MARPAKEQKSAPEENNNKTESMADRIRREATARFKERVKRNGNLDGFNKKLDIDLDIFHKEYPGFVPRWVKDDGARLARMRDIGWEFVPKNEMIAVGDPAVGRGNTDIGDRISVIGGKDNNKEEGAYRLYLMMIPEEIHAQIVAAKQKKNDAKDAEINKLLNGKGEAPVAGAYRPEGPEAKYIP